jgi:hypothetical protein
MNLLLTNTAPMPLYEALPILGAFCAAYLLPSIIAAFRRHHNTAAILALNVLLGWTVLGWVVSLVWAVTAIKKLN